MKMSQFPEGYVTVKPVADRAEIQEYFPVAPPEVGMISTMGLGVVAMVAPYVTL
jgi:hypothetical protein